MNESSKTEKVQIKNRFTGAVLFEADVPDDTPSGLRVRAALEKATQARACLRGADLSGADLRDAYLRGADLRGADLIGADLRDAYLRDAYLRGADLRGADLIGADLIGADLSGADLSGAYLSGAYLRGAYLSGADLRDADLSGAYLSDADLSDADLRDADGEPLPRATPEQAIENLDRVREIILDNKDRLNMRHWHGDDEWQSRTCAEETLCGTTHCLAGWLQVCSTEPAIRNHPSAQLAGVLAAPVASKMFFRSDAEALDWLDKRKYVEETADTERRAAERKAKREAQTGSAT